MGMSSPNYISPELQEKVYTTLYSFYNITKKISPLSVDFEKPWYHLFFLRKWSYAASVISESIQASFENLIPVLFTSSFAAGRMDWLVYICLVYAAIEIMNRYVFYRFFIAQNTVGASYFSSAYSFFMTVDPIYHSTKSSGKIISKITNSWFDFMTLVDQATFNVIPALITFATATITLITFDSSLAWITLPSFLIITIFNGLGSFYNTAVFKPYIIKAREESSGISTENLMQNSLIRATFSTESQLKRYKQSLVKFFATRTSSRITGGFVISITRFLSILSVFAVGARLMNNVINDGMDAAVAGSLVITYYLGIRAIPRVSRVISTTLDAYIGVEDMWNYIRDFGHQSFPVLPQDLEKVETITVDRENNSF